MYKNYKSLGFSNLFASQMAENDSGRRQSDQKSIFLKPLLSLVMMTILLFSAQVSAQCLGTSGLISQYPSTTFTPANTGVPETITNNAFAGEWQAINLVAGSSYEFTSSNATDRHTLSTTASFAAAVAFSASGAPMTYTPTVSGVFYFVSNTPACGTNVASTAKFVKTNLPACVVPTAQATALTLTSTATTFSGSFATNVAAADGYLVVRYPAGAATTIPVDGTTYAVGTAIGLGRVVQSGVSGTIAATTVGVNSSFDVYVYAFRATACSPRLYLTTNPLTGVVSTSSATYTSALTGNFSAATTWIGGIVPPTGSNIIIADGTIVTLDTAVAMANVTIGQGLSGLLQFGTVPANFGILGSLSVSAGGKFNCFNGTTGKSVDVAANITNNGVIDLSTGVVTTNILTLNGTTVQTVSGTGTFASDIIRNLTFNNSNAATVNIFWNLNNVSVGGNLTFIAGKVALGLNKLTLGTGTATGIGAASVGALIINSGGFTSGKFNRYWGAASTGSAIGAGVAPSNATSRYPFIDLSATPSNRSVWIERGTALAAGQLSCTYVNAAASSTVSVLADPGYTVETRYDGNWTFSTEGSTYAATSNEVAISVPGIYPAANGNGRILLANATAGGTHQAGTNFPNFQRVLTVAQLTAGPLYVGANNTDIIIPCVGTPTSGTIPVTAAICSGSAAGISITAIGFTAATGVTFQWEESLDAGGTWGNATGGTGATATTYVTPVLTSSIAYRFKTTCTASGLSSTTNKSTVSIASCTFNTAVSQNASFTSIMPQNGATGTGLGTVFAGWLNSGGDDNTSTAVSVSQTTFTFQGQPVSGFKACSNGWISFNTNTVATDYGLSDGGLGATTATKMLAPFYEDLVFTGQSYANRDTSMRYLVSGTLGSGSAIITVEWAGIELFNNAGPNLNFQVKLYEAGNKIEFVYGTMESFEGTITSQYSYSLGYTGSNPAGTTANDRFALQRENTNFFSTSAAFSNLVSTPACNSMITFTPGTYTGLTAAPVSVPPANDDAAGAIELTPTIGPSTSYCGSYYSSLNATDSLIGQACASSNTFQDDDVWFTFTTNAVADYNIKVRGSYGYDAVVELFDEALVAVTCTNRVGNSSSSQIETISFPNAIAGAIYYVRVFSNTLGSASAVTNRGDFSIAVSSVIAPPTNDNIGTATALTVGGTCVNTNSQLPATLAATASPAVGLPACSGFGFASLLPDDDVWYSFVATANPTVITVQSGAGYNAVINVFSSSNNTPTGTLSSNGCLNSTTTAGAEIITGSLTAGATYFVRVYHAAAGSGTGNFSICVTETLPCTVEYTWNGTAWSPGTPIAGQKIVFTGDYSAGTNLTGCSVDVRNGANVNIGAGTSLTSAGAVTVSSGTLAISSDANLYQTSNAVNSGNITVNRIATMKRLDYTYWSSPVANQNLLAVSPGTLPNRFYAYSGTAWVAAPPATTTMTLAKGYSVRSPNLHPSTLAAYPATFAGVPNNGDVSLTGLSGDYKLVGNPYPSTVSGAAFLAANPGTLYFWTHFASTIDGSTNCNASFNGTGAVAPAGGETPNGTIQVGQGFMYFNAGATAVNFTNAMRTPSTSTQFFRTAPQTALVSEKSRIWLNLAEGENQVGQTLVGYVPNTTTGFDVSFDGKQIQTTGSVLSTMIGSEAMVIQARPTFASNDVVPIGFSAATTGNYSIAIDHVDGLFENGQNIYIKDNLLGTTTIINDVPYTFVSQAGAFNNRFELRYAAALSNVDKIFDANSVVVFNSNNELNIKATSEMQAVKIFDIRGRAIFEKNSINAESTVLAGFAPQQQVLMVQITDKANNIVTKKVIF